MVDRTFAIESPARIGIWLRGGRGGVVVLENSVVSVLGWRELLGEGNKNHVSASYLGCCSLLSFGVSGCMLLLNGILRWLENHIEVLRG